MVDLVLHPGHSKCGSTTIQDFIYANRQRFRQRGVFLPDVNFRFPCHSDYQFDLTQTPRDFLAKVQMGQVGIETLEQSIDDLLLSAEEQGCRRVIISAENLINGIGGGITADIHQLLARKFSNVRIVYYIRRQDELLLSAWQQWGHKEGLSLKDYAEKLINTRFADFLFITDRLKALYPEAALKVFPLKRDYLHDNDLLVDFCTRANIKKDGLKLDIPSSNTGISSALCNSFAKISGVYANQHDQNIKAMINALSHHSEALVDKKYRDDFPSELKQALFERFQQNNETLNQRYFPKVPLSVLSLQQYQVNHESDKIKDLELKIEKLEDLLAIQMDMLLSLTRSSQ